MRIASDPQCGGQGIEYLPAGNIQPSRINDHADICRGLIPSARSRSISASMSAIGGSHVPAGDHTLSVAIIFHAPGGWRQACQFSVAQYLDACALQCVEQLAALSDAGEAMHGFWNYVAQAEGARSASPRKLGGSPRLRASGTGRVIVSLVLISVGGTYHETVW